MKRTKKVIEFNCLRPGDFQPRWHTRQVMLNVEGVECVMFYGDVLTLDYIARCLGGYSVVS